MAVASGANPKAWFAHVPVTDFGARRTRVLIFGALVGYAVNGPSAAAQGVEVVEEVEVALELAAPMDAEGSRNALAIELRPVVDIELGLLFRVCQPSEDQRQQLLAKADAIVEAMLDLQITGPRPRAAFRPQEHVAAVTTGGHSLSANPYQRAQQEIAKAAQEILTPEQLQQYAEECKSLLEFRRSATVAAVIQMLDRQLSLSESQREALQAGLLENWQGALEIGLDNYLNNPNFVPWLPNGVVAQKLTPEQQQIWQKMNKVDWPLQLTGAQGALVWDE